MARLPAAETILDAARKWRDDWLLNGGSIFTEQLLRTHDNAEALHKRYSWTLDLGEGEFFEKLEGQLGDAPAAAVRLAAEALWVMHLIISSGPPSAATKRRRIRRMFSRSGDEIPEDHWALGDVLEFFQLLCEERFARAGFAPR